jgi:hypothetical protein
VPEKRIILSSWASDMFAVESCPGLREIPGMDHPIRLAEILAALRRLDGEDDDPPRPGGVPMRLRRPWAARVAENTMVFTPAVLTMVLLGNSAVWVVPFLALKGGPEASRTR